MPPSKIVERFAEFLVERSEFMLFALGAQRLAAWSPRKARDALRDVVKVADHPQERRIMGLAAATAGEESRFIRRILGEYEENRLVLAMLEDRGFKAI